MLPAPLPQGGDLARAEPSLPVPLPQRDGPAVEGPSSPASPLPVDPAVEERVRRRLPEAAPEDWAAIARGVEEDREWEGRDAATLQLVHDIQQAEEAGVAAWEAERSGPRVTRSRGAKPPPAPVYEEESSSDEGSDEGDGDEEEEEGELGSEEPGEGDDDQGGDPDGGEGGAGAAADAGSDGSSSSMPPTPSTPGYLREPPTSPPP